MAITAALPVKDYLTCSHTEQQSKPDFLHLNSKLERISTAYQQAIQDLSHWLFRLGKPFRITSFISASLLGEPVVSVKSGIDSYFSSWEKELKQHGIYNAADPLTFKQLTNHKTAEAHKKNPVLLLHGTLSHPSIFYYWAKTLDQAVTEKKIGPVFTLQLPDNLQKRMDLVYKTIDAIHNHFKDSKVDIIGHSLGGFAGHLAQIKPEHIHIHEEKNVVRRWHSIQPSHRNEKVGKVVSVAAPTWLCCKGHQDERTTETAQDMYPANIFDPNVEAIYTPKQREEIENHHPDLLDIVASQDVISPTYSPLPKDQVIYVKHRHVGIMHCPEIANIGIKFLATPTETPAPKKFGLDYFKRLLG